MLLKRIARIEYAKYWTSGQTDLRGIWFPRKFLEIATYLKQNDPTRSTPGNTAKNRHLKHGSRGEIVSLPVIYVTIGRSGRKQKTRLESTAADTSPFPCALGVRGAERPGTRVANGGLDAGRLAPGDGRVGGRGDGRGDSGPVPGGRHVTTRSGFQPIRHVLDDDCRPDRHQGEYARSKRKRADDAGAVISGGGESGVYGRIPFTW